MIQESLESSREAMKKRIRVVVSPEAPPEDKAEEFCKADGEIDRKK